MRTTTRHTRRGRLGGSIRAALATATLFVPLLALAEAPRGNPASRIASSDEASGPSNRTWAELVRRGLDLDVLQCPNVRARPST